MRGQSRWLRIVALAAIAVAAFQLFGAEASGAPKLIECQHPVRTGEEAYNLRNVSAETACAVVLDLGHWEYRPGHVRQHISELYTCVGRSKRSPGTPALKMRTFEGWRLSLTPQGDFQMSRNASSFDVTGTDFPLNCT